jgi:hypothetical protein
LSIDRSRLEAAAEGMNTGASTMLVLRLPATMVEALDARAGAAGISPSEAADGATTRRQPSNG